jgi:hypothetical protein
MVKQLLRILLVVPAIAATLSGCSLYVKSDVNTALIGSVHCNSFAWAGTFRGNSPLRNTVASPLNEDRLRSAIAAHLKGGTVQTAPGNADCLVGYGIGNSYVVDDLGPYGYGYGWGWGWGYPLWHASVDQSLYGVTGDKAQKRIDAAVAAIFTKYPG